MLVLNVAALAFAARFLDVIYFAQQEAASGANVIEFHGGVRYLLLPLIIPLITVVAIIERLIKSNFFKRIQGGILIAGGFLLLFSGWWVERSSTYYIENLGYQVCGETYSGIWLTVTLYADSVENCASGKVEGS
ncbi:hypothetical protein EUZ85_06530 [Hahella sp. KA22]|uniref:hypothetical protein n=1 Tax=Hahella sp. KA22 TaxID=1628392 RepID=UPI000FDEA95D|nr:hypothetical protein [Hahella sp. KA22]AZZ90393.1 hypothetical protein ENC22_03980 [Hahella sp. KA22]QAY53763.1 hypothetical protein EUZ85_06530 [Hahella sp. KA22]